MKKQINLILISTVVGIFTALACGLGKEASDQQSHAKALIADDGGGVGNSAPIATACELADFQNAYSAVFLLNTPDQNADPIYPRYFDNGEGNSWVQLFYDEQLDGYQLGVKEVDNEGKVSAHLVVLTDAERSVRVLEVSADNTMMTITPDAIGAQKLRRYLVPKSCVNCVELNNDGLITMDEDQCIIYP